MALSINSVTLVGNLAADPELVERGDYAFCDLRVAVNHGKDGAGEERPASFFDVKTFGATAKACAKYLSKGKRVGVLGELRQERWNDKTTGDPRSVVKIAARQVEFLSPPSNGNGASAPATEAEGDFAPANTEDIPF